MKKLLFILLISLTATAQKTVELADSYNYDYQNLALDYNRSDAVLLVKIKECEKEKIADGLYRINVTAQEIKSYKGSFDNNHFQFDVTEAEVSCFDKDQITGVFLTQTDPKAIKQPYYEMIINSGFKVKDTTIIKQFGNKKNLEKHIKQTLENDEAVNEDPKWVTAKVISEKKTSLLDHSFQHQKIQIQPLFNYPKARMKKGKVYTIEIGASNYGGYGLKNLLQQNNTYEFPIWVDDVAGFPTSNIEFILKN